MSKVHVLRYLVKQRLAEAAEEIFGLFERTIAEYEEEASRIKEDNERLKKRLHPVLNPKVHIEREDVQQLFVPKEEQQEDPESPHIKEEPEDPEPSHIKEEPENPKPSHIKEEPEDPEPSHIKEEPENPEPSHIKEEKLQGLGEAEMKVSFTCVNSEGDIEEAWSSHLHQRQTEQMVTDGDGEEFGGPEPDRNSGSDCPPEPDSDENTGDSSEPETEDSDDWSKTKQPQSGLNSQNNNDGSVSDSRCRTSEKHLMCSDCKKTFGCIKKLKSHMRTHKLEKPFRCLQCGKCFSMGGYLRRHMRCHTGEKPFSCSECGSSFTESGSLKRHMRCHSGAKPFSCLECGKCYVRNGDLKSHMKCHTG
ncbi:zinc finger protein 7-like [Pungitius pungitius]|uniref:zinc finger protein 7-like n=1 Tax=Pungitius pungitius TaxID=134920 RepID=UPI002E0FE581